MLSVIDDVGGTDDGELRILAIDDSRTMLAILEKTLLKLRDLQVETCGDPVEALAMCERAEKRAPRPAGRTGTKAVRGRKETKPGV